VSLTALQQSACGHCGLPTPAGDDFCCAGCRTAHEVLVGAGLERFYELSAGDVRTAQVTGRSYAELDDPAFAALHLEARPGGLAAVSLLLEGVHCAACVWLTERIPSVMPGVVELRLDIGRARADVVFEPARVSLSTIARFIDSLGYPVHPYRGADRDQIRRTEDRALLVRIAIAGAAAGNVMLLAAALYAGMFTDMVAADTRFFRWASMAVTLPAVAYAAAPFFRGAWAAVRTRAIHLDVPIALGILVGVGWGAANTIRDVGEVYFDSIAMLVFLLLVARLVQARQQRRAAGAAELLLALTPSSARRLDGAAAVTEVPIGALTPGDLVEVRAGDTIPIDGTILEGRSSIDLGLLTGESRPVDVAPGEAVCAGTVNLGARLVVRATATGEDTRIGRIVRTVEEQARRRAPIVRFADRVAARFVWIAIAVAAATVALWWRIEPVDGLAHGVENAMALLIVTCPCALGLATPMTFAFAIGRAARRGVLIKGGDALERLAHPGTIFLDKTGTLTEGRVELVAWRGDGTVRSRVRALEVESAHPLARAIVAGIGLGPVLDVADVHETTGGGIEGRVAGRRVVVGSPAFVTARTGTLDVLAPEVDELAARGITPVAIALDGVCVAVAGLADPLRGDAVDTVERVRAAGWQLGILSGDDPRVVARIAGQLGIDAARCRGAVTPEGKLEAVRDALATGPVVMVGDGVNDAAALAAATCGIAVAGGAEASASVADVVVTGRAGARLAPVADVLEGARHTLRVVHRNFGLSLAYNLAGATLAVTGLIHPLIGALMMPISSLTVVSSAAWSRAFRAADKDSR